ncbi:hypothetical protein EZV62_003519 [Acer yangbiense]|uniref:Uncharacterized protein n=1 Tax=Acer yangbiense TaxID=1000413 RepID=A0A5C7IHY1_9ROSI|nr:hypothetical protein EZV62_003519 [Acer yangbiense]
MYNLRYLKFYDDEHHPRSGDINISKVINLPHGLNYLPNELRFLHWNGYPSKALPSTFSLVNLVELDLSTGNIEQLWEGKKHAPKLKRLNLSHSCHLTEMPDLSNTPCLEDINLVNCKSLLDISSSLQHLNKLRNLDLAGCESLRSFSTKIHFESLITLDLSYCTNLIEFPQVSGSSIKSLCLTDTAIEEIPSSIGSLTGLIVLQISHCARLKHISTSICKLKSLESINLIDCSKLESFPEILEPMEHLEVIHLCGTAIKELPSSIENLKGLLRLELRESRNLEWLPSSICNLRHLEELLISDCSKLVKLPDNLGNLRSLKYLDAARAAVTQLPSSLTDLSELEVLICSDCKGLTFSPLSSSLGSLTKLFLNDCNLTEVPEDIGCLPSLLYLELCANDFESLPRSIKNLSKLRMLRLNDCNMLLSIPEFPSDLQKLEAMNCKQLQSLPNVSDFAEFVTQRWIDDDLHFMDTIFVFTNCPRLNQKAFNNVVKESLLSVQQMQTTSQNPEKEDMIRTPVCIWFPGSEIPDWFSHRSFGSSIDVQLAPPQHNRSNCKFLGFALCICHFETNHGDEVVIPGSLGVCVNGDYMNKTFINSDHVALGYWDYSNLLQVWDEYTTFSLKFWPSIDVPNCRVKCCGVCPIYAEPNTTSVEKFGTCIDQEFGKTNKFPDEEMNPRPEIITGSSKSKFLINNRVVLFYRTMRNRVGLFLFYFWIFIACLFCGLFVFGMLGILVLHLSSSCEIYLSYHVQNMQGK